MCHLVYCIHVLVEMMLFPNCIDPQLTRNGRATIEASFGISFTPFLFVSDMDAFNKLVDQNTKDLAIPISIFLFYLWFKCS